MKHSSFTKNAAALALAASMLLGLAGCGGANASAPAPAQSESTAQSEAEAPAQSEEATKSLSDTQKALAEKAQALAAKAQAQDAPTQEAPVQDAPADAYARISLDELRTKALEENEYAAFAVAYLQQADIDSLGVGPTDNGTVARYDFIDTIDEAHRIDVSDGTRESELYCLFPIDPGTGMVVSLVDETTNEAIKEVYRSETGEPILLCCNGEGMPNAKVGFAFDDWTGDFWPMTNDYFGYRYVIEPNGGTCYDFTVYPDFPEEMGTATPPAGNWVGEVLDPNNNFSSVTMTLSLWQGNYAASLFLNDTASGDFMAEYEGTWALKDDEHFTLDLACIENCTGMTEYDGPIKGEYHYALGVEDSMTISVQGLDGTPFYVNHAYEPISFFLQKEGSQPGDDYYDLCLAALNWYETRNNYRPEYAEVTDEIDGDLLIRLYDDMGTHILTCGWCTMNPDTLQGCDYMTGEVIDFSEYADGVG